MGMLPSYIKLTGLMHKRYKFQGPVCSLGNQDIWASHNDLIQYLKEVDCDYKENIEITKHTSRTFSMNSELSDLAHNFIHAKTMFEALNIDEYVDMDKFDSDNPAFLHDLNNPIPNELKNRFGLIFDGGTIEHIFDVKQVLKNITQMLRVDGCVFHICSFSIDHGFYGFSPTLFYDYYGANGFDNFECYLMEVDFSNIIKTYASKHRCIEYKYGMELGGVIDTSKEILIFFAARKMEHCADLAIPTQGSYVRRGNLEGNADAIQQSTFDKAIPKLLQPILTPFRPIMRAFYRKYRQYKLVKSATIKFI